MCKQTSKSPAISLVFAVFFSASAVAENDPLRGMFRQGRIIAAEKLGQLKPCSLPPGTPQDVRQFLIDNKSTLRNDVLRAKHAWVRNETPECALSQPRIGAPIRLSMPTCKQVVADARHAADLLLIETLNHLGVNGPMAKRVMKTLKSSDPHCKHDPFSVNSCIGTILAADDVLDRIPAISTNRVLGNFEISVRTQECSKLGRNCKDWKVSKNPKFGDKVLWAGRYYRRKGPDELFRFARLPRTGRFLIQRDQLGNPWVSIESDLGKFYELRGKTWRRTSEPYGYYSRTAYTRRLGYRVDLPLDRWDQWSDSVFARPVRFKGHPNIGDNAFYGEGFTFTGFVRSSCTRLEAFGDNAKRLGRKKLIRVHAVLIARY